MNQYLLNQLNQNPKEMNPENQLNQQKPNFERIAEIITSGLKYTSSEEYDSTLKSWKGIFQWQWENIVSGESKYSDNPLLLELLQKYNLLSFYVDFKFIGFLATHWQKVNSDLCDTDKKNKGLKLEVLHALKLFNDYQKGITINFVRKQKIQASIQNPELINFISQKLIEFYSLKYLRLGWGKPMPEDITEWGDFLSSMIIDEKAITSKKGRRKVINSISNFSFYLHQYLQEYTSIKAEAGAGYSNEQARIIFSFLEIHGLIENPDKISRKEDVIAYHLKSYKQRRIKN